MHRIMPESEYNFQTFLFFIFRSFDNNVMCYDIRNSVCSDISIGSLLYNDIDILIYAKIDDISFYYSKHFVRYEIYENKFLFI